MSTAMTEIAVLPATAHTPARRPPQRGYWRNVLKRFLRDRIGLVCLMVLLAIALAAIFAPLLAPADPYRTSMIRRLIAPGEKGFLLGTDELGRDMLSRLLYGGRVSLSMGIAPIVLSTMIGGGLGVIAGYFGRHINMMIMRVIDVFYAFPSVLLAVAMAGVLGSGILNSLISLTLVFIPPIARVAESVTTQVRNQDFVEAARATGAGSARIIISSGLSFLGLGASPPTADWGLMLNTLRQAVYVAPVNAVLPGVMIFLTSVSFNLVSDSLRTAMDVRA
jgi:peptide/nickel transport system permease protein